MFTLAYVLLFYFYDGYFLVGNSMEPTLHEEDFVLVQTETEAFERRDVVLFQPEDSEWIFSKRIIGLPGEIVEGRNHRVYINEKPLAEPYTQPSINDFGPVKVPKDHVFVLGDNRLESADSREFGPIPIRSIIGRADVIVYPLNHLKWL
ncbi:signal peptidase I [Paludifilum halophilum]|uniref:Signal peptidase I n=3 Tax=Paludifilum halophilum TaxID=1642702 RepID=A0A235B3C5_9BACL|nr:signal peptidase I [Paludifilum halophilum]